MVAALHSSGCRALPLYRTFRMGHRGLVAHSSVYPFRVWQWELAVPF